MVLNFFFVLSQLLFHFAQGTIEGNTSFRRRLRRYEIVLVLGIDQDFGLSLIVREIKRHLNRGDAVKKCQQFLCALADVFTRFRMKITVATGDGNLH